MSKVLMLAPEKCTNCRTCELACSFQHEKQFNPTQSRVSVLSWESAGIAVPIMCLQCDNAACAKVCPVGAITRNEETGAMVINQMKCIKCKMCINACPFGCTGYDSLTRTIIKCDLCSGDPQCAKNCASGAITFRDGNTANLGKKKVIASKFMKIFGEVN
ncbi:4Fe-4S dicluster domain-containing protein [Dehalobacter sp. DCM]|uniref:4Fe-4S dicluster domain-containing protein n=1 Tax=Dehalobacter sp. DCM TaxID=2907827 RepID=UPI0030814DEB|nr:4Fe-4S dicluster domain-containing protein [Dehalobacter sp. DCM]